VQHYEAVRKEALSRTGHQIRGLALLMRHGVASWMRIVSEQLTNVQAQERQSKEVEDVQLPINTEQSVVDILAAMAWGNHIGGLS
jgi:hypothetical protein